jgi:hypothetical protein
LENISCCKDSVFLFLLSIFGAGTKVFPFESYVDLLQYLPGREQKAGGAAGRETAGAGGSNLRTGPRVRTNRVLKQAQVQI